MAYRSYDPSPSGQDAADVPPPPRSSVNRSLILFAALTAALLIGLFFLFKPTPPSPAVTVETPTAATDEAGSSTAQPAPTPEAQPVRLVLAQGHLSDGPAIIRVEQGTRLRLTIVSDGAGQWHLHGYDLHAQLTEQTPAEVTFVAAHSGRFEHELHGTGQHAHGALGVIEVYPPSP